MNVISKWLRLKNDSFILKIFIFSLLNKLLNKINKLTTSRIKSETKIFFQFSSINLIDLTGFHVEKRSGRWPTGLRHKRQSFTSIRSPSLLVVTLSFVFHSRHRSGRLWQVAIACEKPAYTTIACFSILPPFIVNFGHVNRRRVVIGILV